MAKAIDLLVKIHSWKLEKLSPATAACDVTMRLRKGMSAKELEGALALVKRGAAYRCRIGKGRRFFGDTPEAAARNAVDGAKAK